MILVILEAPTVGIDGAITYPEHPSTSAMRSPGLRTLFSKVLRPEPLLIIYVYVYIYIYAYLYGIWGPGMSHKMLPSRNLKKGTPI